VVNLHLPQAINAIVKTMCEPAISGRRNCGKSELIYKMSLSEFSKLNPTSMVVLVHPSDSANPF